MKFITAFILTFAFCQVCFSQTMDTLRIYEHEKFPDNWKLEVRNNKTFRLYNSLVGRNEFTTTGICSFSDTTVAFLCDTTKLKNKNLAGDKLKQFTNIPFILSGESFARLSGFFIPHNINYEPDSISLTLPKGAIARYYRGDGYGSNIVELKEDSTYIFYDNSCMAHFTEKGTWSLNNGIISFYPMGKTGSMLDWITTNKKLYLTEDYLIGKKITKTYTKTRKPVVTEIYSYLSKEPQAHID